MCAYTHELDNVNTAERVSGKRNGNCYNRFKRFKLVLKNIEGGSDLDLARPTLHPAALKAEASTVQEAVMQNTFYRRWFKTIRI